MLKGYEDGLFTEEELDKAVTRILAAQHKAYEMSRNEAEITEKDIENRFFSKCRKTLLQEVTI